MKTTLRKVTALLFAIILYYAVHEGAHFLFAQIFGVYGGSRFMGFGMQILLTDRNALTDLEFGILNGAGAVFTLFTAYLLVFFARKLCALKNLPIRAVLYYTTLVLLLNDPLYLSVLYDFFGGGDMNGILFLGIPEQAASIGFAVIGLINLGVALKYIYPLYKNSYAQTAVSPGNRH